MSHLISAPIVVSTGSDCAFYREIGDVRRAGLPANSTVFDALGTRLVVSDGWVAIAPSADGADELARILRSWLGMMDALRESTAEWSLALLVRAAVEHLGFS